MNESIKAALFELIKKQLIAALIKEIPFLGSRIFSPITSILISHILKIAFEKTELALYFYQVDLETGKQASAVDEAQKALKDAKTDEEKSIAENKLKDSLRDLVKLKPK
jgi:hypothetical protein